jgi:hypothetical protein
MDIRLVDVSEADIASARIFFNVLTEYYDTSEFSVLDMFARNGQLTIDNYKGKVKRVEAWELMEQHREALDAKKVDSICIGCSYQTAKIKEGKYDMIVIDTPQGIHTSFDGKQCVEHLSAIESALPLTKDNCIIVLYVNKKPYNKDEYGSHGYDEYSEYNYKLWMDHRKQFYQTGDGNITEAQAIISYTALLSGFGYNVKNVIAVPCFSDVAGIEPYAFRLALEITKM